MKTVIIEDEKPAARRLQRILQKQGIETEILLHSVEEATHWFLNHSHPDLIFLDIQLSDGISFEIFENIEIKSAIIFTTAYDKYALKAFKLNAIDYLLKPIDEDELIQAINKYKENTLQTTLANFNKIKQLLNPSLTKEFKKRITIKIGQRLKIININEIECFYSENKATYIYTTNNRSYLLNNSLEYWNEQVNPKSFYRVNRTFIININAIKDIISYSNSRLEVTLNYYKNTKIIVSRERVKDFKTWIS